jgi:hypothetical protein
VSSQEGINVFQMAVETILGMGKIFVPVEYFSRIFARYFTGRFEFDEVNNLITVAISDVLPNFKNI